MTTRARAVLKSQFPCSVTKINVPSKTKLTVFHAIFFYTTSPFILAFAFSGCVYAGIWKWESLVFVVVHFEFTSIYLVFWDVS